MFENARIRLNTHACRNLNGERLEDEQAFIATLSDESCEQYLRVIEAKEEDIANFYT